MRMGSEGVGAHVLRATPSRVCGRSNLAILSSHSKGELLGSKPIIPEVAVCGMQCVYCRIAFCICVSSQ